MRAVLLVIVFVVAGTLFEAFAQLPQGAGLGRNFQLPVYRVTPGGGKFLDYVVTGSSATNLPDGMGLVNDFELKSFRNGDAKQVQIIVQAPHCRVDLGAGKRAWDDGPLQFFTPTTNLIVRGKGFMFTEINHFLVVSNQVETQVAKSMMKTSLMGSSRTNTPTAAPEKILIFADFATFDFDGNVVNYAGNVHMIDPQLDLTSHLLTIHFTTNGAVESIQAKMDVVLTTTNHGRATGVAGLYYVTNGNEMMKLTTYAVWRNGDEEAKAEEFIYDSSRHLLTGTGHVRVTWPNGAGASGASPAGTNGFRKMFADSAILQFPPTNGPVESMRAQGNVILVNQADQSSALADKADYEKALDRVDLSGHPVWRNPTVEVKGEMLTAEIGAKTYYARTNAHFKMLTGGDLNLPASGIQWTYVASDDMEYRTNEVRFIRNVAARVVQNEQLQETLTCALLTLQLSNTTVECGSATGQVRGETAPDKAGFIKTLACERLNVYPAEKKGWLKSVDAHGNVVMEEIGAGPTVLTTNRLAADNVTVRFSAETNQIEEGVADKNVVFDQIRDGRKIQATSARAVYTTGSNDLITLTGAPIARNDNFTIIESDFLTWQPKSGKFGASGHYKLIPNKMPARKKPL
jgi:lipopolysaccharide export system protein LptA